MSENSCILKSVCKSNKRFDKTCRKAGIETLIRCAKERGDDSVLCCLEEVLSSNVEQNLELHKSCYCTYISKDKIAKLKKAKKRSKEAEQSEAGPSKHTRSTTNSSGFQYKTHCIFCNEECLPKDIRHPDRWRKCCECTTKKRFDKEGNPYPSFQEVILDIAKQRNDEVSRRVQCNLQAAIDLPSVEARYHFDCYQAFYNIPLFSTLPNADSGCDSALLAVIASFNADSSRLWNTLELHSVYLDVGGMLTRKAMINKFRSCLDDKIAIVHIEGCASIIGTKETVGNTLKLVKLVEEEEDSFIDKTVRKIRKEACSLKYKSAMYDMSDFNSTNTVGTTSTTLLDLVAKLVSGGDTTMKSLCISQIIQSHITKTRNQTTLGLAVKLHHEHGSSKLIRLLNRFGLTVTYDEVLRFQKSAAKFLSDNPNIFNEFMGLDINNGAICGWFDNLDLMLCTPNGSKSLHAMIHEFQQPSPMNTSGLARACPSQSKLIIPRLNKRQSKGAMCSSTLTLDHFTGQKNPLPPMTCNTVGLSFDEIKHRNHSLKRANKIDMDWLNQIESCENPMEWSGYNNYIARADDHCPKRVASTYVIGPLLDAPPNHPDTVYTSMIYMQKNMEAMGMKTIHLSVDMQLYIIGSQVKWSYPEKFQNIIFRPGIMHVIMSACGSIGKLNQGTGLDRLLSAAYGGISGIMSGSSWVKALRAFRMVTSTLLHNFLSTGQKTFDDLSSYFDEVRLLPTGRHWVDNFIIPTLLVHQLVRAEREGDFYLQKYALSKLLIYLFAAGHFHYARYLTQFLEEAKCFPSDVIAELKNGLFVCRHQAGVWNSVSFDQFGEQVTVRHKKDV